MRPWVPLLDGGEPGDVGLEQLVVRESLEEQPFEGVLDERRFSLAEDRINFSVTWVIR